MSVARMLGWVVTLVIVGAVGLALYTAAQLYVPERGPPRQLVLMNSPHIALVATLPQTPEFPKFAGYDDKGELIQLDLGYSYREISALWMPFVAYEDLGYVLFARRDNDISIAPLTDIDRAAITKATGRDLTTSYNFPIYAHIWGWLAAIAFAGFNVILYRRAANRRDAGLGS